MLDRHRGQAQLLFWLGVAVLFVLAILLFQEILLPFVAGTVLAYALNPLVDRMERVGLGRLAASAIIVALLVVVIVLVMVFLAPLLVDQARQFIESLPDAVRKIQTVVEQWARDQFGDRFSDVRTAIDSAIAKASEKDWSDVAGQVAKSLWDQGQAVLDFLSLLFITPIVVFYLLVDWPTMLASLRSWLPRDHQTTLLRLAGEIDEAISAFVRGQGIVCLVLGTLYAVGLSVAGLKYGLLIGIATGVMTFVPVVGTALGLITASILALVQEWPDPTLLAMVVAIFATGQALDSGFLAPRVVGPKVGLHPVALIFSLFVFSYLFGFVGVLVAVPLAAAVGVLIRFALELYLSSPYYLGTGNSGKGEGQGGTGDP